LGSSAKVIDMVGGTVAGGCVKGGKDELPGKYGKGDIEDTSQWSSGGKGKNRPRQTEVINQTVKSLPAWTKKGTLGL